MFGSLGVLNAFSTYSIFNLWWVYGDVILSLVEKDLYIHFSLTEILYQFTPLPLVKGICLHRPSASLKFIYLFITLSRSLFRSLGKQEEKKRKMSTKLLWSFSLFRTELMTYINFQFIHLIYPGEVLQPLLQNSVLISICLHPSYVISTDAGYWM